MEQAIWKACYTVAGSVNKLKTIQLTRLHAYMRANLERRPRWHHP
jgi:hypothetical protein